MSLISVSQAQDGVTGVNAASINTPINTIVNDYNGNITDANIAANAAINQSKIGLALLGAQGVSVTAGESTTSTAYTDLATTSDTVTVTIGSTGMALVSIYALLQNSQGSSISYVSFAVSGANTIAASDLLNLEYTTPPSGANFFGAYGATFLMTALTGGSSTFKMKYRVNANEGTFGQRRIAVIPL